MNKEINYEMFVVGNSVSHNNFNTSTEKYKEMQADNKNIALVTHNIHTGYCRVTFWQKGSGLSFFVTTVPNTLSDETELLTFIADKVELLLGTLFDEGTTFNLESLSYYND